MQRENFALCPENFLSAGQMSQQGFYLQKKFDLMRQSGSPYLSAKGFGKFPSHRGSAAAVSWVQARGVGCEGPSPRRLYFSP